MFINSLHQQLQVFLPVLTNSKLTTVKKDSFPLPLFHTGYTYFSTFKYFFYSQIIIHLSKLHTKNKIQDIYYP